MGSADVLGLEALTLLAVLTASTARCIAWLQPVPWVALGRLFLA